MLRVTTIVVLFVYCLGAVPKQFKSHSQSRIVGGTSANITNYPYQVAMEVDEVIHCGGSIVSKDWVLTAAHCIEFAEVKQVRFRAGSSYHATGGSLHPAEEFISNPNYDTNTVDYDIAVIKVSIPFQFDDTVQIIPMTSESPTTGTPVVVTGWGLVSNSTERPDQLQAVQVNIVDFNYCNSLYEEPYWSLTSRMICAGVPEGDRGVCGGDSGGPLVSGGEVVGIVSWGADCNYEAQVYTNVANLKSWVSSVTDII